MMNISIVPILLSIALFVVCAAEDPATNTTDSESSSATNYESSNSILQSMYININKPALSSQITKLVYASESLASPFNSCTLETPPITSTTLNVTNTPCFLDDAYNGRLSFQLTFTADPTDVKSVLISRPPEVTTTEAAKSIAFPMVISPSEDDDDTDDHPNSLSITVLYNCKSNDKGVVPLSLTIHFGQDEKDDVVINWQKVCENGINDKIDYGYLTGDEDMGNENLHSFGQDTSALVTVGASDQSTEFFMKLQQPGALQTFMAPYITSTFSNIVSLTIRGNHPQGGLVEGLAITKFQIGYECHQKGEATIEATIGIPPFQNVSAVWKKDCGGTAASKLQVGTKEDGFDIVDNGEPTPRYMVGIDNIGTDHSDEHMHLPGNQSDWTFFVKNGDMQEGHDTGTADTDTALIVGRITATVEDSSVLFPMTPIIMVRTAMTWRRASKSGSISSYTLRAGDSIKVIVPLICKQSGKESRVLITVPVLEYKELEFGVAKECTHVGEAHKSSQFILTVGTAFWGTFLIVVVVGVWFVRRRNAQKGASFTPVPQHE